jgi:hypothetical protein
MVGAAYIQKSRTRNGKEQQMFYSPEDTVRHLRFSGSVERSALEKLKPSTGNSQGQNGILGRELLEARPNIAGCASAPTSNSTADITILFGDLTGPRKSKYFGGKDYCELVHVFAEGVLATRSLYLLAQS